MSKIKAVFLSLVCIIASFSLCSCASTAKKAVKTSAKTTVAGAKATAGGVKGATKGVTGIGKDKGKDIKKDGKNIKKQILSETAGQRNGSDRVTAQFR